MQKIERLSFFRDLSIKLKRFSVEEIENSISKYFLDSINKKNTETDSKYSKDILNILSDASFPTELEFIIEFFEFLLESNKKNENGIVFTPKFIADYIFNTLLEKAPWTKQKKIIDPGCGGGIFLVSAIEIIHKKYNIPVDYLIENCIYGIDIEKDNTRRCKIILKLLSAKYDGDFENIKPNIICCDSLKTNWSKEFKVNEFSYVIGNPPYVNPHALNKKISDFLKSTFTTTKNGVFNIFYAFIEHGMNNLSDSGNLGYIVPNNFLTIKSAANLREFIKSNKFLYKIIDFADNMIFRPTRTYNCIIFLNKRSNESLSYHIADPTNNIEKYLKNITFNNLNTTLLDKHGWKLVDKNTRSNLSKIENNPVIIKPFIRTGIATLKDAVFMVESDEIGYYKLINQEKIYLEEGIIKPIYKIPELKLFESIKGAERYIIFPYKKSSEGYILIDENDLTHNYPNTYKVLLFFKDLLYSRDKGKPNPQAWYAYGRSQGLNKYGKKILFPTFSDKPKFMYVNNDDALFCNGYGIFENDYYSLNILIKILNSSVMDYYVKNTSYSIEGGYYCYQKKYIERFSIPKLTKDQIHKINNLTGQELDDFIWDLYQLNLE